MATELVPKVLLEAVPDRIDRLRIAQTDFSALKSAFALDEEG